MSVCTAPTGCAGGKFELVATAQAANATGTKAMIASEYRRTGLGARGLAVPPIYVGTTSRECASRGPKRTAARSSSLAPDSGSCDGRYTTRLSAVSA